MDEILAGAKFGGEGRIRTAGTGFPVRLFSKQLVSATHPLLRNETWTDLKSTLPHPWGVDQ